MEPRDRSLKNSHSKWTVLWGGGQQQRPPDRPAAAAAALVLEVKGDFCYATERESSILVGHRAQDT